MSVAVVAVGLSAWSATSTVPVVAVPTGDSGCDFDADGYEDLAIGVPREDLETQPTGNQGVVQVIYGSSDGLAAERNQMWHQNSPGIGGASEGGDGFGQTLACGDFDGNGSDDLAIGVPDEDIGTTPDPNAAEVFNGGAVQIIYGSPSGLIATGNQWWSQGWFGLAGQVEFDDRFGAALAAGDFDGDGTDDLAVGVPDEDIGAIVDAGGVQVIYGSAAGLTAVDNQWWDQSAPGIADGPEASDRFGAELTTGDYNGDGSDDLAIGVPKEDIGTIVDAGGVHMLYGSVSGLATGGAQWWYQELPDVLGGSELRDRYGENLTTGDFDGDNADDLAIGIPGEGAGTRADSGAVHVMYGTASGLTASDDQWWDQGSPGILGALERHDNFGDEVSAGDFDGDGITDLAIGVGEEFVDFPSGRVAYPGLVQVIFGSASGLAATGNESWSQASPGILGAAEQGDWFGAWSLAVLNTDGDGQDDLVVGVPREALGSVLTAGAVNVVYGSPTGLTAQGNQWWDQNSPGIAGAVEAEDWFAQELAGR
jgi:hypothetical protein